MLSFEVRSLAMDAARVAGTLHADDPIWMPEDARPDDGLQVTGRVSVAGHGRYYFSGRFAGTVTLECRRCLTPVAGAVTVDVAAIFSEADNEDAGDPDVFDLAEGGTMVDVRPAIREQWLLHVPRFAECRPDCRGLCPQCGKDLNTGACSCVPATDRRLDALRAVRSKAD